MNIDDLTLGQIKQLKSMFGGCAMFNKTSSENNSVKIVILQRGWVVVGRWFQNGEMCRIENGYVVRSWGTTNGLGELAEKGKLESTRLDKSKNIQFHILTMVASMDCDENKWEVLCPKL